jgi:hypothetical protein
MVANRAWFVPVTSVVRVHPYEKGITAGSDLAVVVVGRAVT